MHSKKWNGDQLAPNSLKRSREIVEAALEGRAEGVNGTRRDVAPEAALDGAQDPVGGFEESFALGSEGGDENAAVDGVMRANNPAILFSALDEHLRGLRGDVAVASQLGAGTAWRVSDGGEETNLGGGDAVNPQLLVHFQAQLGEDALHKLGDAARRVEIEVVRFTDGSLRHISLLI
jgi:hypothetical protein